MKLITVKVTPKAKKNEIEEVGESKFTVSVKAKPKQGMANEAVRAMIAGYFKVSSDHVRIIRGRSSTHKVVEVKE